MATFDLDAVRAEQSAEHKAVKIGGHEFELAPVLTVATFKAISKLASGDAAAALDGFDTIMVALFGENADAAAELISPSDVNLIVTQFYGVGAGESSASPVS